MRIQQSWRKIPFWLRGGLLGVGICIALFFFYILVYFPLLKNESGISSKALLLPMITGQGFPILSHFIVPHGFLCENTVKHCTHWVSEAFIEDYKKGLIPKESLPKDYVCDSLVQEGVQGCCATWTYSPSVTCATISEGVGFFGMILLLLGIYFGIGAGVGSMLQKRKSRK